MAYVKMRKGNIVANIFDSPEMIASAKSDGYVIVPEEEAPVKKVEKTDTEVDVEKTKTEVKTSGRVKRQ